MLRFLLQRGKFICSPARACKIEGRRVHILLKRDGLPVNPKRIYRLYKEIDLQLRDKIPKRRVKAKLGSDRTQATHSNHVWAMDRFLPAWQADAQQLIKSSNGKFRAESARTLAFVLADYARKNRREKLTRQTDDRTHAWIEEAPQFLLEQRQSAVDEIAACPQSDAELANKADVLMSLKGIGLRTACFLMAGLPELGLIDKGQIAELTGVAPLNRDSGLMRGKRMIAGGRKPVRCSLYARLTSHPLRPRHEGFLHKSQTSERAIMQVVDSQRIRTLSRQGRAHEGGYSNHQRST